VTLVADAAPLIALADEIDPRRSEIAAVLEAERGDIILPAFVAAEVDYLVGRRTGRSARRAFLLDLANRRFRVECLLPMEYEMILQLDQQYADLDVGLADLSVFVLARRFGTRRILTFDERHFRTLRPLDGGAFTILPADEQRAPH
jgi:uncharacterized protein